MRGVSCAPAISADQKFVSAPQTLLDRIRRASHLLIELAERVENLVRLTDRMLKNAGEITHAEKRDGARYRFRTCDPLRVREVLYH